MDLSCSGRDKKELTRQAKVLARGDRPKLLSTNLEARQDNGLKHLQLNLNFTTTRFPKWRTGARTANAKLERKANLLQLCSWSIIIGLVIVAVACVAAWVLSPKGETQTTMAPTYYTTKRRLEARGCEAYELKWTTLI
ncbi:V-type proton ATPase subunit e protein [Rutstroemia sp. NJR-2017a BVV2]|nr:V-type proton ATPase subunit e protein [Rutstroemia sp. NJR-2017a BVV2]